MDAFSLGQYLREAREAKELTLAQAETTLKIRRHILEGFEQGDFNVIDASPVQIRGFIRNYARYLDLEEERVLQHYDSVLQSANRAANRQRDRQNKRKNGKNTADKRSKQNTPAVPLQPNGRSSQETPSAAGYMALGEQRRKPSMLLRLFNIVLVIGIGLLSLAVIAFVMLELIGTPPDSNIEESENAPGEGILGDLPPTFTLTARPSATPLRTITVVPQSVQNYAGQPVLVTLEVRQRVWLYFEADGVVRFSGLLRPNEAVIEYPANTQILVRSSNAAALVVTYNGQPQPTLGGRGQMVEIRFRPNNDIEIISGPGFDPTAEFSPTPPDTPTSIAGTLVAELTPSITPGPSPTPSLTPTASDTPEATLTPSATATDTLTPTITLTPTETLTPTLTFTPSLTPTDTQTPTLTYTPSQTAILPPRITPTPATPVKPAPTQ